MTDIFNFILVMVSLVLAIGVTHLVQGVATVIRLRGTTRLETLPLVWSASLFLVAAIFWWSLWDLRGADWRFYHFFYMLLAPTLLHVAATLLISTNALESGASMRSEFDRIRGPFMVVMAIFSVLVTCKGLVVGVEPVWTVYRPVQVSVIGLYIAGIVFGGIRAQHIIAWLVFTIYVVAGFFFRFMPGAFGS